MIQPQAIFTMTIRPFTLMLGQFMNYLLPLILILSTITLAQSEEIKIALVNKSALDDCTEMLVLKSEEGRKLLQRKLVVDKLYAEAQAAKSIDQNALCSESVTLSKVIDGEKQYMQKIIIEEN